MRPRDPRVALADALAAGAAVERFLRGKTLDEYAGDELLSSGVERQFEIIGEALSRAIKADASLEARIPEVAGVIGFRNVLAHGYDAVSDTLVWSIARDRLPELLVRLRVLLDELT